MNGVIVHIPADEEQAIPAIVFSRAQISPPYFVVSAAFSTIRTGGATTVTVMPILSGAVYYFWFLDGAYAGMTTEPSRTFVLDSGGQATVDCLQTFDPLFDPTVFAMPGYPAVRTLEFVRSIDPNVAEYRIEQQRASGAWTVLGRVADDSSRWTYSVVTPRLDDLTSYGWRVVPIDAAGNDGTTLTLAQELIVRTPDAPRFTVTFDPLNDQVAFGAA